MWCGTLRSVSRISGLLWNPVKLSLQSRIQASPGYKCLDKYSISHKGFSTSCNLMQTKDSDAGAQKSGYDIYYWPGAPGRAEFIRLIFAEVGETYKDVDDIEGIETVSLSTQTEGFPNYAPPVLKDGDFLLAQTPVICRYLGEKFGLVPENKTDRWRADQLNATLHDFIAEGCLVFHAKNFVEEYSTQKEETAGHIEWFLKERFGPRWLSYFEAALAKNNGGQGFLVGDKLTYVDLGLLHVLRASESQFPKEWKKLDNIPLLKVYKDRLSKRPNLAAYFESDRCLPFSGDSMM